MESNWHMRLERQADVQVAPSLWPGQDRDATDRNWGPVVSSFSNGWLLDSGATQTLPLRALMMKPAAQGPAISGLVVAGLAWPSELKQLPSLPLAPGYQARACVATPLRAADPRGQPQKSLSFSQMLHLQKLSMVGDCPDVKYWKK